MSEQANKLHVIDRTGWSPGPWDNEPDKVQWTTAAGLPGLIVRNWQGVLCGYAGVDRAHPHYGHEYEDLQLDVHGGLTYADRCEADGPICHIPAPGQPDEVWWFGFDTAHFQDLIPGMDALRRQAGLTLRDTDVLRGTYRDLAYVQAEVESLAAQLVALERQ